MLIRKAFRRNYITEVCLSVSEHWLPLAEEYDSFLQQAALWEKKKKHYMVKCQSPSRCQRDWQQFLVLLEYVSSWESINVLQASGGRMKASPVINSICLLSSLRQRRRPRWEEDSESCAKGERAKGPGMLGLEGRGLGGGYLIGSLKIQGLFCERERFAGQS